MNDWINRINIKSDLDFLLDIFNIRFDLLIFKLVILELTTGNKFLLSCIIKYTNKLSNEYFIYSLMINRYKFIEKNLYKRFSRLTVETVFNYIV